MIVESTLIAVGAVSAPVADCHQPRVAMIYNDHDISCLVSDGPLPFFMAPEAAVSPADDEASAAAPQQGDEAERQPSPRTLSILLPLLIDDRYLGDIQVQLSGDMVLLDAARLAELLRPEITGPTLEALIGRSGGAAQIDPAKASGENLILRYNPQLQQVEAVIPSSARQLRTLSASTDLSEIRTGAEEEPAGISLFASTLFAPEYSWQGSDKGFNRLGGQLTLGGRVGGYGGVAFLSRHSYSFSSDQPSFTREETALIYDDVRRLVRVTAGDVVPRGTGFQSVPLVAGLSVERLFDLQPERIFRPVGNTSFQLDQTATVQLRINGVIQREFQLEPGRYNLRDLPLTQGSNLVDIVIRDGTGREIVLSDRNFFDFDLLAPGVTEFSASAGVRSSFGLRAPSYSDDPVFSGFARRGLSETVTAGFDAQVDQRGGNGGVSVLWAAPIGVFRLQAAGSTRKGFGGGAAAEIGYRATGAFGQTGSTRFSLDLRAEHRTANFATINDLAPPPLGEPNQTTSNIFNIAGQMFRDRITVSGSASYSMGRGSRRNTSAALLGATYQLSRQWSVGAFARHLDDGRSRSTGGFLQLIWRPSQTVDARARYDTIDREAQLQIRKSAPRTVGAVSYGADARYSDADDEGSANADMFYVGNRFEAGVSHRIDTSGGFSNITNQRTRLAIGTSLAFADGAFAIGRPVRDSFAIVSRHATLGRRPVRIDETDRGYTAATDFIGPALVTELSGYSSRSIYYAVNDLPPGYDLGTGQFVLRAPLNAGYKLTVGTDASYSIVGAVKIAGTGEPVTYVGGALYALDDPSAPPLSAFTNRNGRLVAIGLKPGRYRLELATEPKTTREITITQGPQQLIDIGIIEVEAP